VAAGKDVIDLGIGDPDQPTPPAIVAELAKYAGQTWTNRYDESPHGVPDYLAAVSEWFGRTYGVTLDPETQVLLLIGSKEGLAHLNWAYCDPRDVVIVPEPGYSVYEVNAKMAGAETHVVPLRPENDFLMQFDAIPAGIAERAKLLFLCYPNNPTAATATIDYFQRALEFCEKHNILLVNDAAYCQVCYDGYKAPSLMQVPGAAERAVEFHSLSKMFNMTGWRIGFMVGSPPVVATLARFKANLDSKQFMAIAMAGAYALRHVSNQETFDLYRRRRDILVGGLRKLGWNVPSPKATFYVWAPVPPGYDSARFATELLEKADIVCIPGVGYGQAGEGFVRMSLTVSGDRNGERVAEVVSRIEQCGFRFQDGT
jgi:LL-diaminopimelate aminotransferase